MNLQRKEPLGSPPTALKNRSEVINNLNLPLSAIDCKPLDPWEFTFASWSRSLINAKPENRLRIFAEMSKDGAAYTYGVRQDAVDALWLIAEDTGLITQHGPDAVQAALAAAFVEEPCPRAI